MACRSISSSELGGLTGAAGRGAVAGGEGAGPGRSARWVAVMSVASEVMRLRSMAWGEVPDLVEEEGPRRRQLEAPGLLPVRPREGPPLVAEELGLEQGVGEGGPIDRHEGAHGLALREARATSTFPR